MSAEQKDLGDSAMGDGEKTCPCCQFFCPKSDGEHQEHRFRFWPAAGSEQPGYRDPDASALDSGAVLPALDADDGYPEQHCLGTSAGSHSASASSTAAAPRQAC